MAWNNNSGGGPWGGGGGGGGSGGGGGGPWGGGGGGGNRGGGAAVAARSARGARPTWKTSFARARSGSRTSFPAASAPTRASPSWCWRCLVIWLVTGFFRVQPNQQAIQLVFGKPYGKPVEPGLHYNLPAPIGNVVVVNVQDQRRTVLGSRGNQVSTPYTRGPRPTSTENLMLTGDENIVDIEFAVLWQIKDVFKYAFDVRNPEENVRSGAEAAMREVIGKSNLQYAQTEGRSRIEQDTKDLLQRILDEYGLGVRISQIQLLRVDPPQEVIAAFRDVQAARADKEKLHQRGQHLSQPAAPAGQGRGRIDRPARARPTRPRSSPAPAATRSASTRSTSSGPRPRTSRPSVSTSTRWKRCCAT